MDEYICSDCGKRFQQDEAEYRDDGSYEEYWGAKVWMPYEVMVCPYCGSDDIEETEEYEEEEEEEESNDQ